MSEPTPALIYAQEKARVDAYMAQAAAQWNQQNPMAMDWAAVWAGMHSYTDEPPTYNPQNEEHVAERREWEIQQEWRRQREVFAAMVEAGVITASVVEAYTRIQSEQGIQRPEPPPAALDRGVTVGDVAGREAVQAKTAEPKGQTREPQSWMSRLMTWGKELFVSQEEKTTMLESTKALAPELGQARKVPWADIHTGPRAVPVSREQEQQRSRERDEQRGMER